MVAFGFGLGKLIGGRVLIYSGKVSNRCLTIRFVDDPQPTLRTETLEKQTLLTANVNKANFTNSFALVSKLASTISHR